MDNRTKKYLYDVCRSFVGSWHFTDGIDQPLEETLADTNWTTAEAFCMGVAYALPTQDIELVETYNMLHDIWDEVYRLSCDGKDDEATWMLMGTQFRLGRN